MLGAVLLRRGFGQLSAAVNRRDLDAIGAALADDAVFEFPGQVPVSGRHEGRAAVREFWRRVFEHYATFTLTPVHIALARPYAVGLTNTGFLEWRAHARTHDGLEMHAAGVAVIEFRRGKVVHARDYFFDPTLLEPVWGVQRRTATAG